MRPTCSDADDRDLIEAAQVQIRENGNLLLRSAVVVNGVTLSPGVFSLLHLGPVPARTPHEWIDIRNSIIVSGSACKKCGALRAENFDQPQSEK